MALADITTDCRFALRGLRRNPGFAAAAVLTLAGGIGAVTAILSVVNGVILRPLPYPNAARAVLVWGTGRPGTPVAGTEFPFSPANFVDLKAENRSLQITAAFRAWPMTFASANGAELLSGAKVSSGFFEALGVQPFIGRTFTPEDDVAGAEPVAILSHAIWRNRFAADPGIAGRVIRLNDSSYTVVGVMPPGFQFPRGGELPPGFRFAARTEVWTPIAIAPSLLKARGMWNIAVLALPKAGVTRQAAQADVRLVMDRLGESYPGTNKNLTASLAGLLDGPRARVGPALFVLLGAVSFLLVLACANVANLLLARTLGRAREVAVRGALGAPRSRLLAQFLTENLTLALTGGALGMALAIGLERALLALAPAQLPRLDDIGIDWRVFALVVLIVLVVGIVLGVVSGAFVTSTGGLEELRDGTRTGGSRGARRLRHALAIGEVAVSVTLLAGAGALGRTFVNLRRVDPGFDPRGLVTAQMVMPVFAQDFSSMGQRAAVWSRFYIRSTEAVAAATGVRAAGVVTSLPLSGAWESTAFRIEGGPPAQLGEGPTAFFAGVSGGYFSAMGIPLIKGRLFDRGDADSARSAIVSAALAAKYWPAGDALGRRVQLFSPTPLEIVGIVGDVHQTELGREAEPMLYLPLSVYPSPSMTLVVRTSADPQGLMGEIRQRVAAIDAAVPLTQVRTMPDVLGESLAQQRFSATLLGLFAAAAMGLAILGLYGVIAYGVAQRSRELGVRLAIGAAPTRVLAMVVREGAVLGLAGVAIGLVAAVALGRLLSGLVFGVSPTDPLTLAAVGVLLGGMAVVAAWIPARRAMRLDPAAALRAE